VYRLPIAVGDRQPATATCLAAAKLVTWRAETKQLEGVMSLAKEFKEFAMRGNVIDLAVGVVIGAAFGKIVSALVDAIIMPAIGVLTAGNDFSNLAAQIGTSKAGEPVLLKYGVFVQSIADFVIIAVVIFLAIRGINRLKKPAPGAPPPTPPRQEVLLEEIRNLLAKK
jgi:large conductance mechanosensitive channel